MVDSVVFEKLVDLKVFEKFRYSKLCYSKLFKAAVFEVLW